MGNHLRVLLAGVSVEDEAAILQALHRAGNSTEHLRFEELGHAVDQAGLEWDLLFLDDSTSGAAPFDILKQLAGLPGAPPVILVTTQTGESMAGEWIRAGASDVVLNTRLEHLELPIARAVREGQSRKARARAESQVARLNRVQQLRASVNSIILRVQDSLDLLQQICDLVSRFGHFDLVRVVREQGQELETIVRSAATAKQAPEVPSLGLERRAWGVGESMIWNEPESLAQDGATVFHSGGIFPLRVAGRVWGFLSVFSRLPSALTPEDVVMVNELSADVAWAVETRIRDEQSRSSNEFLQEMTSLVPGLFYKLQRTADQRWQFQYVSPGIDLFLPLTPEQILADSSRMLDAIHPLDRDRYWQTMERSARDLTVFSMEFRLVKPNGTPVWTLATAFPQRRDDASIVWSGLAIDVTPKNRLQEALLREQELLDVTLQNIGDGVIVIGEGGEVVLINRTAENLLHWPSEQILGKHWSDLAVRLPWEALDTLTPWSVTPPDGNPLHLETHVSNLLDRDGEERGRVMLLRDVTEREKIEERLRQSEKLESVGLLAGGIAHDFNNLLTGVFGFLQLARLYADEKDKVQEYLDASLGPFERARALTQQLLTFAKGGQPSRQPIRLESLAESTLRFLLADTGLGWSLDVEETLVSVVANEGQIAQVFENLILNARQILSRDTGHISVRMMNRVHAGGGSLDLAEGTYLVVEVADNGPGIPANVLPRIFDPFFTTKATGTGLGLSICFSVIKKHHGTLEVETSEGGTLFRIYLPAAPRASE